jgi:putative transposase
MPRRPRLSPIGVPQHIIQRGNNRQVCFTSDNDIAAYAGWLDEAAKKYGVAIHAWIFMTNHVHLLATPQKEASLSAMMQYLGRFYVRYFNLNYQRTGTLWEGRFHSCLIQSEAYLLTCQRYIELNPVRAGMAQDPADYKWSSYRANGMGIESKLVTYHPLYLGLGNSKFERLKNYRLLFESELDKNLVSDIRYATNKGLILGTDKFKAEVAALTDRRTQPQKRGPKSKPQ